MEGYSNLGPYKKHPLAQVYLKFTPSTFDPELQKFLSFVQNSSTVEELNESIFKAGQKISSLDAFDECQVKVLPGKHINTAEAQFFLTQKQLFSPQIGLKSDPIELSLVSYFRNCFGSVNSLMLKLGLELESKNKTFVVDYLSKIGLWNKFQYGLQIEKSSSFLDVCVQEHLYSIGPYLKSFDNTQFIKLGYYLRSNEIFVNQASAELIKEGLLPSSKFSLSYKYSEPDFPVLSSLFGVAFKAELAFSSQLEFLKLEKSVSKSWSLSDKLKILLNLDLGYILPIQSPQVTLNDRFRYKDFKGFRFLGRRFQANNEYLAEKVVVAGDHLGTRGKLTGDVQLVHNSFPLFSRFGIHPFLFASAAYLQESSSFKSNTRAAAGFGAKLMLPFGYLEFVYSSKVWAQPGDCPAEFQIFFKET